MASSLRPMRAIALMAGLALALAACGGPEDPSDDGDGDYDQITVLFPSAMNNTPMMVAAENGYWRDRGLDVTVNVLDSGAEIATALSTGAADIGAANATTAIPLSRAAGNDLVCVGAYHNNPLVLAGTERVGIVASSDSGAREGDPESLRGLSIGVAQGGTPEVYLRAYLEEHGMSMSDVQVVNLSVPDMPTALSQGNVDAVVPWEPQISQIVRTQDDIVLVERGGPYGTSVVCVMVSADFLAEHPDIVERYVAGAWEGDKFTRENPQDAAAIAQRYIQGLNVEDAASGLERMATEFDPRISPCTEHAVMLEQELMIDEGIMNLSEPMPYGEIVAVDFIESLLAANEELLEGLPPLPQSVEECE